MVEFRKTYGSSSFRVYCVWDVAKKNRKMWEFFPSRGKEFGRWTIWKPAKSQNCTSHPGWFHWCVVVSKDHKHVFTFYNSSRTLLFVAISFSWFQSMTALLVGVVLCFLKVVGIEDLWKQLKDKLVGSIMFVCLFSQTSLMATIISLNLFL